MSQDELTRALDELAHAAAHPQDTDRATTALAAAVLDLERAAGARLGPVAGDPLVVLQRRLGRLHGLLLAAPHGVDAGRVRSHLAALLTGPGAAAGCTAGCPDVPVIRAGRLTPATV